MFKRYLCVILSFLTLACLLLSCSGTSVKKLEGSYATESTTGSYVLYEFTEDGSVTCRSYMLDIKVSEESGTYEINKDEITFTYGEEIKTFPFEYTDKDSIVINGNTYYKQ